MKIFEARQNCCGCTACVQICPRGALSLWPDSEGFLYPVVDRSACVDCGLCRRVCAFQRDQKAKNSPENDSTINPLKVLAVKHRNIAIRSQSQSGGLFTLLSDPILSRGGVVYGAGFCPDWIVCHQRAETIEARDALRGSKYVQSDLGNTFQSVRDDLLQKREVLFSGTPCQIAALRSFLMMGKIDIKRLLLCDLVCHGVPSPMIWRDYLAWREQKTGQKIKNVVFRDSKRFGWHSGMGTILFANGLLEETGVFSHLFYGRLIHRLSCYACPYATPRRVSDVTMADYWGIERAHPDFSDNIGVSLALIHSDKGSQALSEASERMEVVESDIESCRQTQLRRPAAPSPHRAEFWANYTQKGFQDASKRYVAKTLARSRLNALVRRSETLSRLVQAFRRIV